MASAGGSSGLLSATFTLTQAEFAKARRRVQLRNWAMRSMLGAGLVTLVVGALLLTAPRQTALGIQLGMLNLFIAALNLVSVGLQITVGAWRAYHRNAALLAPQTWEFSDEGVRVDAVIGSSRMKWAAYRYARLDRDFLFLHLRTGAFQVVPRRGLASEADHARLIDLVGHHLPVKGHP